jgi:hypothetical protein
MLLMSNALIPRRHDIINLEDKPSSNDDRTYDGIILCDDEGRQEAST